ncbi:MAG: hypothetical protein OEY59_03150 [Deltaproteobacteria bacterium]|nr:hypothetical protein [Deltaproteobacteria bacterium]
MKGKMYVSIITTVLICCFYSFTVIANPFERRRDQFQNTPGYLALPFPYSIPGIGEGLFLVGTANNVFGTSTDILGMGLTGDALGYYGSVDELFVLPGSLYLHAEKGIAARFGQNVYQSRGMGSKKEDFNIFVGEDSSFASYKAVLTLFNRHLELEYGLSDFKGKFVEIRDFEGNPIQKLAKPIEFQSKNTLLQVRLDLTDDYNDPRSGLNIKTTQEHNPAQNIDAPEFNTLTTALTLYIPMLKKSTWLFHYYRSDANVIKAGNVDLESLKTQHGFDNCGGLAACESAVMASALNQLNANKNGTSKSLGGTDRLRSYPLDRYKSAHAQLFGTEFRWNFNSEGKIIDWLFLEDIVDSLQAAFYLEQGSVAENKEDLGDITRNSVGAALRFVGRSGSVYRLELATGDEGTEVIAFFDFPWTGSI